MPASVEEVENSESQGNVENIFRHNSTNVNSYRDFVSRKFIGFCQYPIDVENYKCPLSW
jgi:hypothetical protein